jgi:NAD-dependent SIR2 family protein deacetylase
MVDALLTAAAAALKSADALLIGAGAGMGVDSGLPDFRGPEGFWQAYPPYRRLGLNFIDLASPEWFDRDPALAWGFYGHRRNLYRKTAPHAGFQILRKRADRMRLGTFIFTSNVDGHFQKAGFPIERVMEVHGSVDWQQCTRRCAASIYPAEADEIDLDETTMRAREPLPRCPQCGKLARPNILMFGDYGWDSSRTDDQHALLERWARHLDGARLVIVECGAGRGVPTVRHFCERIAAAAVGLLVRINVRECDVPEGNIGLPMGALEALREIDARMSRFSERQG